MGDIEINMNSDAGWNGSGGPWIKHEHSMQKVVSARTKVEGPRRLYILEKASRVSAASPKTVQ